jgi:SAM-dependent methyltransferase
MQETEYHNLARLESTHWWYAGMAALAADWLGRLPARDANGAPAGRVLDAGCGTGGGLQWLAQFGRVWGIDQHPLALTLAAENGRSRLVQADVQALPFAEDSFTILTSFDVLYHARVNNDWDALREFTRVLRPGGWLLLRLPAHDWLRGGHDQTVHTRHRYSRGEILAKLHAAGLRPIRVTYVNAFLFFPVIFWRGLQRGLGLRPASDVRPLPRLFNAGLAALLAVERVWLRHFDLPVGLGLLALAQKSP